jgi:hypothetical protein
MDKTEVYIVDDSWYYRLVEEHYSKVQEVNFDPIHWDNQDIGTSCYLKFNIDESDKTDMTLDEVEFHYPDEGMSILYTQGHIESGIYFMHVGY